MTIPFSRNSTLKTLAPIGYSYTLADCLDPEKKIVCKAWCSMSDLSRVVVHKFHSLLHMREPVGQEVLPFPSLWIVLTSLVAAKPKTKVRYVVPNSDH